MNRLKNNWLKSLIINAVILVTVFLCTTVIYGTNDDLAISQRIAADYPYISFVNYYLCRILISLQHISGSVNIFILSQMICSFVAFVILLKVIMDNADATYDGSFSSRILQVVAGMSVLVFSFDHYCNITYTKTAALLMIAGMITATDCLFGHNRSSKHVLAYYIASFLLIYLGVMYRADSYIAAIGFAGVYVLMWLIMNRERLKKDGYLGKESLLAYVVTAALLLGGFGLNALSSTANNSTDELKLAREYSEYRSNAVDFGAYGTYEKNAGAYNAIGLDENDMYLIDCWYFDYDGAASLDNLKAIDGIRSSVSDSDTAVSHLNISRFIRDFLKCVKRTDQTGVALIVMSLLTIVMLVSLKPKHWLYILLTCGLTLALYLYLYSLGRSAYRALYIANVGCVFWMLYYFSVFNGANDASVRSVSDNLAKRRLIACAIFTLSCIILLVPITRNESSEYAINLGCVIPDELIEYTDADSDSLYVFATSEKLQPAYYMTPLKVPAGTGENITGTGSWGTMSPYMNDILAGYGVTNPMKDLINNKSAYFIGNKRIERLTEYYNKWYGADYGTISFDPVTTVGGFNIWQLVSE